MILLFPGNDLDEGSGTGVPVGEEVEGLGEAEGELVDDDHSSNQTHSISTIILPPIHLFTPTLQHQALPPVFALSSPSSGRSYNFGLNNARCCNSEY